MNENGIYKRIKQALAQSPINQFTAKMHLQMIKLKDESAKEFCEGVGLRESFVTKFTKIRNLTLRIKATGLNTGLL
jgi:hypothetical protein